MDENGFPKLGRREENDRYRHPIRCLVCLAPKGASVSVARNGAITLYCEICLTRAFIKTPAGHETLRRWSRLLENEQFANTMIETLAALP